MPFSNSGSILRADLNVLVEEAANVSDLFIADKVLPPYEVPNRNGQYPKFKVGKGELLNDDISARTPAGSYNRIIREYENDTYNTVDRGLEELVDDSARSDIERFFDLEAFTAKTVLRQVQMQFEKRVAAAIQATGTFANTGAAVAYTEANLATINFPLDVMNACDQLTKYGVRANTLIINNLLANRIKRSTIFQNFVRGNLPSGQPIVVSNNDLARGFADYGITNCLIGAANYNSAKKGQTFSATNVWSSLYIWVGYVAAGDPMAGGAGRTFVWNDEGGLWVTEQYREENRRSNIIRVRQNTDEKIIDATCGYIVSTSYA